MSALLDTILVQPMITFINWFICHFHEKISQCCVKVENAGTHQYQKWHYKRHTCHKPDRKSHIFLLQVSLSFKNSLENKVFWWRSYSRCHCQSNCRTKSCSCLKKDLRCNSACHSHNWPTSGVTMYINKKKNQKLTLKIIYVCKYCWEVYKHSQNIFY